MTTSAPVCVGSVNRLQPIHSYLRRKMAWRDAFASLPSPRTTARYGACNLVPLLLISVLLTFPLQSRSSSVCVLGRLIARLVILFLSYLIQS